MSGANTIETQMTDLLKEAMRSKDQRTKDVIAMIKTKHMERRTAAGFKGALDDSLWLEVIGAYQKQVRKTRDEYAGLGDKGAETLPQLDFEIAFCARFLPKLAGDDEVRAAVKETLTRLGPTDPKQSGRVMGEIMKANKGKFDPAAVKRIVEEELAKG
jgi:uncharacterized protein YqeY